jgi:hypothetical protein
MQMSLKIKIKKNKELIAADKMENFLEITKPSLASKFTRSFETASYFHNQSSFLEEDGELSQNPSLENWLKSQEFITEKPKPKSASHQTDIRSKGPETSGNFRFKGKNHEDNAKKGNRKLQKQTSNSSLLEALNDNIYEGEDGNVNCSFTSYGEDFKSGGGNIWNEKNERFYRKSSEKPLDQAVKAHYNICKNLFSYYNFDPNIIHHKNAIQGIDKIPINKEAQMQVRNQLYAKEIHKIYKKNALRISKNTSLAHAIMNATNANLGFNPFKSVEDASSDLSKYFPLVKSTQGARNKNQSQSSISKSKKASYELPKTGHKKIERNFYKHEEKVNQAVARNIGKYFPSGASLSRKIDFGKCIS